MLSGDNGILTKAGQAKTNWKDAETEEKQTLEEFANQIKNYTRNKLAE